MAPSMVKGGFPLAFFFSDLGIRKEGNLPPPPPVVLFSLWLSLSSAAASSLPLPSSSSELSRNLDLQTRLALWAGYHAKTSVEAA